MKTPPPCAGLHELFDSIDLVDHREARNICDTCPLIAACRAELEATRAAAKPGRDYGPQGTWAGELIGSNGRISPARALAEADMFTPAELRAGHSAYTRGDRSPRSVLAERIYQRKRSRKRYASSKGEAA